MAKSNQGTSYPNQGKRSSRVNPNTGQAVKNNIKVHKGKGKKNPPVPGWLH